MERTDQRPAMSRPPYLTTRRVIVVALVRSAIVFAVLGALSLWALRAAGLAEAKKDAGSTAELSTRVALAPFLTDELLAHDPVAYQQLAHAAATFAQYRQIARMKIWSADNEVIWSDDPRLVGQVFELEPDERELFRTFGAIVGVSDLDKEENVFEVQDGQTKLLEVYFGTQTASGQPLLVETYYSYSYVTALVDDYQSRFFPLLLAGLGLLTLVQVPLALTLARQLNRSQHDRERLLQRAIDVSDTERRRIAAEVHDGAVQELLGVAFSLTAKARHADPPLSDELGVLAGATRSTVRTLRSLLSSIYPVAVPPEGWVAGIDDLVTELRSKGVAVDLEVAAQRPPHVEELLILRVAREALRNISAHADASEVAVRLSHHGGAYVLEVEDDGQGFDDVVAAARRRQGHLGLELLKDLAHDAAANVMITSAPGEGTTVRLELAAHR